MSNSESTGRWVERERYPSPEGYERLWRVQAYLQMLRLSNSLRESGVRADELFRASRQELEDRLSRGHAGDEEI